MFVCLPYFHPRHSKQSRLWPLCSGSRKPNDSDHWDSQAAICEAPHHARKLLLWVSMAATEAGQRIELVGDALLQLALWRAGGMVDESRRDTKHLLWLAT